MRLVQFFSREGLRAVGMPDEAGRRLKVLEGVERVYDLALLALQQGQSLVLAAEERVGAASEDYDGVVAERRLLPPLDHPDPSHCLARKGVVEGKSVPVRLDPAGRRDIRKTK